MKKKNIRKNKVVDLDDSQLKSLKLESNQIEEEEQEDPELKIEKSTVLSEKSNYNYSTEMLLKESHYEYSIDEEATLFAMKNNFSIIKYIQLGLITNKHAFQSPIVSHMNFFFLVKTTVTQILLQTLVYNPRLQIVLIIAFELFYMFGSLVKHITIKHFIKPSFLIHLFG